MNNEKIIRFSVDVDGKEETKDIVIQQHMSGDCIKEIFVNSAKCDSVLGCELLQDRVFKDGQKWRKAVKMSFESLDPEEKTYKFCVNCKRFS